MHLIFLPVAALYEILEMFLLIDLKTLYNALNVPKNGALTGQYIHCTKKLGFSLMISLVMKNLIFCALLSHGTCTFSCSLHEYVKIR